MNKESLNRPPLDVRKVKKTPGDAKKVFYQNSSNFKTTINSLEKIQRSLTPSIGRKRQDPRTHHKIPVKSEKSERT